MSSQSSSSSSMSRNNSQSNCPDPLDGLVDFSQYEQVDYHSPSPSTSSKSQFSRPSAASTPALLPPPQPLSGPSHQYNAHKQQTGIPAGALASTLAINQQMYGYGYGSGIGDESFDFNAMPAQASYDMDMEFDSPSATPAFFFGEQATGGFVDPNVIGGQELAASTTSVQPGGFSRVYPGMHQQQAALAKAQQQQRQQQQLIQQQRQQISQPRQRKANQAADPIVEEKISQLLHSMRQGSVATSDGGDDGATPQGNMRSRKEEEEMDEDERLLASEEGKKLSSKERRQLRNKVSARAFRSRRKEYIGQLEGEIAAKVNENSDLRSQNRALLEENKRLSDLTRMLLASPSFSGFLDTMSTAPAPQQAAPMMKVEQQPETRPAPKDVNPYAAAQQMQNQQIHYTMMPEQPVMDFSMLDLNTNDYIFQPQVYSVHAVPEVVIDTAILSGKSTTTCDIFPSQEAKVEIPVLERLAFETLASEKSAVANDEFDADPSFALFVDNIPASSSTELDLTSIFNGIHKPTQYVLVNAATVDASAAAATAKLERLAASLDETMARLEAMTIDL